MNAMTVSARPSRIALAEDRAMVFGVPANDDLLTAPGAIFGPEEAMQVSFAGLSPDETARALASFPGARRCVLGDA